MLLLTLAKLIYRSAIAQKKEWNKNGGKEKNGVDSCDISIPNES